MVLVVSLSIRHKHASVLHPSMFIAHEPQIPSRQDRRKVREGSDSFLILICGMGRYPGIDGYQVKCDRLGRNLGRQTGGANRVGLRGSRETLHQQVSLQERHQLTKASSIIGPHWLRSTLKLCNVGFSAGVSGFCMCKSTMGRRGNGEAAQETDHGQPQSY